MIAKDSINAPRVMIRISEFPSLMSVSSRRSSLLTLELEGRQSLAVRFAVDCVENRFVGWALWCHSYWISSSPVAWRCGLGAM